MDRRLNAPPGGKRFVVMIETRQRRGLDWAALPDHILKDGRYWKTSRTSVVTALVQRI